MDSKQKAARLIEELAKRKIALVDSDDLTKLTDVMEAAEKWLELFEVMSRYHDQLSTLDVIEAFRYCLAGRKPGV